MNALEQEVTGIQGGDMAVVWYAATVAEIATSDNPFKHIAKYFSIWNEPYRGAGQMEGVYCLGLEMHQGARGVSFVPFSNYRTTSFGHDVWCVWQARGAAFTSSGGTARRSSL